MTHHSLRLAAAQHVLGLAKSEDYVNAAHEALNDNIYSSSLCELVIVNDQRREDYTRLFQAALQELEIPLPSRSEAIETMMEGYVAQLAEGAGHPQDVLPQFFTLELSAVVYGAERELLKPFINLHWVIDQYFDHPEYPLTAAQEAALELEFAEAVTEARAWCLEHMTSRINAAWRTSTVMALAAGIRAELAFDRLPILADALQDAGCDDEELLRHLRGDGPHVHGCWVVDLILGNA